MNELKYIIATVFCLFMFIPVQAEKYQGNVDAKEIVFEHIQDSYDWHITQFGDRHITIPILIIVYSEETGWHAFSSSHLQHGHTYQGFKYATEGAYRGRVVEIKSNEKRYGRLIFPLQKPYFPYSSIA